ncbi:hypothetical protein KDC22_13930 [Paenibacillus tritici]|uniref:hypothetical protein n=1 Tax=Paenibacillus tritici TaxID=1873425 RepID=UPI001BAB403C|nr:hypothetical protein [Paenibacillus tritici]QUL57472.1 hypothetical protein KDC22_13930 [Paenibacillus tritici]
MNKSTRTIIAGATALMLTMAPAAAYAEQPSRGRATAAPDSMHAGQEHHHPRGGDRNFRAGGHFILSETAKLLGISRPELIDSLKSGKTLSGLAQEKKGWSEDQYIQKLSEAASLKLDEFVKDGKLTQEDAAKLKPGLPLLIKRSLSRTAQLHQIKPSQQPAATKSP